MARYELEDHQRDLIKGLMPQQGRGGKWNDHRTTLNGILWVLKSGASWRDMPERYGKWKSVHERLCRWRSNGTFDRILTALRGFGEIHTLACSGRHNQTLPFGRRKAKVDRERVPLRLLMCIRHSSMLQE